MFGGPEEECLPLAVFWVPGLSHWETLGIFCRSQKDRVTSNQCSRVLSSSRPCWVLQQPHNKQVPKENDEGIYPPSKFRLLTAVASDEEQSQGFLFFFYPSLFFSEFRPELLLWQEALKREPSDPHPPADSDSCDIWGRPRSSKWRAAAVCHWLSAGGGRDLWAVTMESHLIPQGPRFSPHLPPLPLKPTQYVLIWTKRY